VEMRRKSFRAGLDIDKSLVGAGRHPQLLLQEIQEIGPFEPRVQEPVDAKWRCLLKSGLG
jgi:hypothetical protein